VRDCETPTVAFEDESARTTTFVVVEELGRTGDGNVEADSDDVNVSGSKVWAIGEPRSLRQNIRRAVTAS